jgi:REP element-mobilizing transposase RayT
MTGYKNRFQKGSRRLQGYDYGSDGVYFITICTKVRHHFFGEIENGQMSLSLAGHIVQNEWLKTPDIRKTMDIRLDEYQIMPNHFHCIVIIGQPSLSSRDKRLPSTNSTPNKFAPQYQNLSTIIRGFKGACTSKIHEIGISDFKWQSRFHDHIIRDKESWENIRNYIIQNPQKWHEDKLCS